MNVDLRSIVESDHFGSTIYLQCVELLFCFFSFFFSFFSGGVVLWVVFVFPTSNAVMALNSMQFKGANHNIL